MTQMTHTSLAVVCAAAWTVAAALSGTLGIWTAIGSVAVMLGVVIALLDLPATRITLRPTVPLVAIGVVVGGVMSAATYWLYPLVLSAAPSVAADTTSLYAAFRAPAQVVTWFALIPVVISEELVWRGVVQRAITERLAFGDRSWVGPLAGVTLTAMAYGGAHGLVGSPVLVVTSFLCGVVWSGLRAVTGSVAPALVAHLLWDVVVLLWLPLG
jgi:membrane protease YdiL (CAAX protease family)